MCGQCFLSHKSRNSLLNCANGTKAFAELNGAQGGVIVVRKRFVIRTSLGEDMEEANANGSMSKEGPHSNVGSQ